MPVNGLDDFLLQCSAADIGLVGRNDQNESSVLELPACFRHSRKNDELINGKWWVRSAIDDLAFVDDTITVEKHCLLRSRRVHNLLTLFVGRRGKLSARSPTSSCSPSVLDVKR